MTWDAFTQAVPTASSPAAKITPVAIAGHHAPAASCPRPGSAMRKVLILTNDFPPRAGVIQSFVHALAMRLPVGSVTVYAPAWHGAAEFDASLPFPVVRHPTSLMLPIPSVARRAAQIIEREGCDTVLFGAAAPLALLGPWLRKAGARRLIAITHGHEVGWAALPVARNLLRRIGDSVDTVTYLGEYTRTRLARHCHRRRWTGWPGSLRVWMSQSSTPGTVAEPSGIGSGLGSGRWWCVCPGWCPVRARTRSSGLGRRCVW